MIRHVEDWGQHKGPSLEIMNFLLATLFQRFILITISNVFRKPTLAGQRCTGQERFLGGVFRGGPHVGFDCGASSALAPAVRLFSDFDPCSRNYVDCARRLDCASNGRGRP